jgi:hypothetical protein
MSSDVLIAKIEQEILRNGGNRHLYPLSMGQSRGRWSVVVEVDSAKRTFDIETTSTSLTAALADALTQIRRQYAHPNR